MTSRERILMTLMHKEPDRVPIDIGGADAASIGVGPYQELCAKLGINEDIYMTNLIEQIPVLDRQVSDAMNSDAIAVTLLPQKWKKGTAYNGSEVWVPEKFNEKLKNDGSRIVEDKAGVARFKMPSEGYFFDFVHFPLQQIKTIEELDVAADEMENFDRSSWLDLPLDELSQKTKDLRTNCDKALIGHFSGHIFQAGQLLRGWSDFLLDLAVNPKLAEAIMDRLVEGHIRAFDKYAETVGKYVDVIQVNDDLGMQNSLWMSPEHYRRVVKPYMGKLYGHIKQRSGKPLLMHNDGAISPLIPDLIEMGVNAINPVQYSAKDMELKKLKSEFGKDITFWGGGVDTQHILPFGKPHEVANEVKHNLEILAPGGGFVFATIHNIIEGVPVENVLSAFKAARDNGKY